MTNISKIELPNGDFIFVNTIDLPEIAKLLYEKFGWFNEFRR